MCWEQLQAQLSAVCKDIHEAQSKSYRWAWPWKREQTYCSCWVLPFDFVWGPLGQRQGLRAFHDSKGGSQREDIFLKPQLFYGYIYATLKMRARSSEMKLNLQCFRLGKRHWFIPEIANSRCLVWLMPTNKVVWALILFHLFHNRERKQERLWIILELQDPFHPGMWKSHFPLTDLVISRRWWGFLGRQVTPQMWILSHLLRSMLMKLPRLERRQGGAKHCSQ